MKTQTFTIGMVLLLLVSIIVKAEHVETNDAATVGKNYYWENCQISQTLTYDKVNLSLFETRTQNDLPLFYVFNINDSDGFIIVAADDNVKPVLGYSTSGNWDGNNLPPALIQMINRFEAQITEVIINKLEGDAEIDASWEKYQKMVPPAPKSKSVTPMLNTTWNQGIYYNQQCPADASGPDGHAYAGCVAVSMAQVMYYHQHPAQGVGSNSYTHPVYGTISANFGTTTYNYSSMPVSLSSYNFPVSQFMFHCGVSVDMNYGPGGSAPMGTNWDTDIEDALKNNFDYSSSLQWKWKNSFSTSVWISMLKSELDLSRPIIYYGWDGNPTGSAHNFNCDGYDNSNNFHFNWGWGGYYDGYYPVTNLNPASGYNYTYYQGAIFGMTPNQSQPQNDYDWGDAPDNPGYPTLSANNGARHLVSNPVSICLGTLIDTETDGQPDINCKGDDNNNLDDEDGVIFPTMLVGSTVTIVVNAFGNGVLSAWMDFNQDGDWADAGEQIFAFSILTTGSHNLTLNIPATASVGWTYARFRYSTQAALSYTGAASDGEVEDYFVRINEEGGSTSNDRNILFSVDIGSDTELSDPVADMDEVFDPGDAYLFPGTYMPFPGTDGYFDDVQAFGNDPMPDGGVPGTGAPCLSGMPIEELKYSFFDMDGIDLTICDLREFTFGEGMPPIEKFDEPFIHNADSLYISFDDDDAFPYTDPSGSIPRFGFSPAGMIYGQQQNNDEIFEVDINLTYPLQAQIVSVTPKYDEVTIHPNLTPDPDINGGNDPNEHDDDVDALDVPYALNDLARTYFSADHEAVYVDFNGMPLNPGSIYLAEGGMAIEVINAQTDIGLFPDTDVDAFEFTWAINPQYNYLALAMIFSVDDDDPTTPGDESGGMNPNELYLTFMTGWWIDLTQDGLQDDIDAITIFETTSPQQTPKADFTPLNSVIYAGQSIQFTDISTNAPTSWNWTFNGGNPSSHTGPVPPLVLYANPGTYSVSLSVSNASGTNTKTGSVQVMPSNWQFTTSNLSHIISVPLTVLPAANGVQLYNGDLIGVFYTDNLGNEMCGGYCVWDTTNNGVVIAYGDDITTSGKDGFAAGEIFTWKVFNWITFTTYNEYQISVTYNQTLPNFDGKYYDYGISSLTSLYSYQSQLINVFQGWSGISGYLNPANPNLDTILSPILNNLVILQNFSGVYWPAMALNTLVNWNSTDGYVVKVNQDVALNIQGSPVTNKTLNLASGWHLVPALNSNAAPASGIFGVSGVMIVKEVAGNKIYWPSQNIFTLNMVNPGEAYFLYATTNVTLNYPAKSAPIETITPMHENSGNSPWETIDPTPNSHIVIISKEVSAMFSEGDVIGAFNSHGLNVGYAKITTEDISLSIYGDDITTPIVDGMTEGEKITYKIHRLLTNDDVDIIPDFDSELPNSGVEFETNGLSKMTLKTGISEDRDLSTIDVYPNPATDFICIDLKGNTSGEIHIQLINIIGNIVFEKTNSNNLKCMMDVSGLAEGCYVMRLSTETKTISKRVVIRK